MCIGAVLEGPVAPQTPWAVPDNAGTCMLRVFGTPGATFRFIEQT